MRSGQTILIALVTFASVSCRAEDQSERIGLVKRLAEQFSAMTRASERADVSLKVMGAQELWRVQEANEQALTIERQGISLPYQWSRISNQDLASMARSVAGKNGDRLLLAAELSLLSGQTSSALELLAGALAASPQLEAKVTAIKKKALAQTAPPTPQTPQPKVDSKTVAKPPPPPVVKNQLIPTKKASVKNYQGVLAALKPGDVLLLEAGTYTGDLQLNHMKGELGKPIVITGPASGERAVFKANSSNNTVELSECSFVTIANLELDGLSLDAPFGFSSKGTCHDITIENCHIHDYSGCQQTDGISTKGDAWNWTIRGNLIERAGTGLYLGNSDGRFPFFNGIIEYNVVLNTTGYCMQIKHQNSRPEVKGIERGTTIIRHNVFAKTIWIDKGNDGARPNLLVGGPPKSGPGADDRYLIYGNFFYKNPREALFQGTGSITFYDNVLFNPDGPGVNVQPHDGSKPRSILVFNNTILAKTHGLSIISAEKSTVMENAVFSGQSAGATNDQGIQRSYDDAAKFLVNPFGDLGKMDLAPVSGKLLIAGNSPEVSMLNDFPDFDRDFNGNSQAFKVYGAYSVEGANAGWPLGLNQKNVQPK